MGTVEVVVGGRPILARRKSIIRSLMLDLERHQIGQRNGDQRFGRCCKIRRDGTNGSKDIARDGEGGV